MLYLALPGFVELLPILIILVLLFGAKKLPELARAMGSSINQFKKGLGDAEEEARREGLPKGSAARELPAGGTLSSTGESGAAGEQEESRAP